MSSGISATKAELYAPAGIALVLSIIGLIIGILLLIQTKNDGDATQIVTSVATSNGFKGSIAKNTLTVQSTNLGILTGPGLLQAQSEDITFTKLAGFNNANTGTMITSADTIKSGLEKVLVLNLTPLVGLIPGASSIDDSITVFDATNRLSGGLLNLMAPFCVYTPITTNSQTRVNLWGNMNGSSTFQPNAINIGTSWDLQIFGDVLGPPSGETATYILQLDGDDFITLVSPGTGGSAVTRDIRIFINLTFDTLNIYYTGRCQILNNPALSIQLSTTFVSGQTVFDRTQQHILGFVGFTSMVGMSTTVRSSICTAVAGLGL
jgi:hypothetical protein